MHALIWIYTICISNAEIFANLDEQMKEKKEEAKLEEKCSENVVRFELVRLVCCINSGVITFYFSILKI